MPIRQIKTEGRCKICKSPYRDQIDALLELRSNAGKDEAGVRVTQGYVFEKMEAWGISNPTKDNLTSHWQNHCEVVTSESLVAIDDSVAKAIAGMEQGEYADVDQTLREMLTIARAELTAKVATGQKSGLTADHIIKISDAITRRNQSDAQSELLRAVGGGIQAALAGGVRPQLGTAPEDVIEGEFEEVA